MLVPALAILGAVLWLGPRDAWWSVVAWARPSTPTAAWRHVPAEVPILVAVEPRKLLTSPVARAVRPRLEELARLHGVDLAIAESGIGLAVACFAGSGEGYLVGTGVGLSPSLLPQLDGRWRPAAPAGARGATDGLVYLGAIAPGVTLGSRLDFAATAIERARAAADDGDGVVRLPLDEPGLTLRGEVVPDLELRREMSHYLPEQGDYLAHDLVRAEARIAASEELEIALALEHRTEEAATRTDALLRQADAAGKLARQLGPLAKVLLKGDAALVTEIPPLTVGKTGATVDVMLAAPADQVDRWLGILLERTKRKLPPAPLPGRP